MMETSIQETRISAKKLRQPINIPCLESWLSTNCPEIHLPVTALQSNPTYLLTASNGFRFVLRKKPPMKLVSKKIHWIEREYAVLECLATKDIPVPKVYGFCSDESILGTPFYLMEYLDGRIFEEASIAGVSARDREDMWKDVVRVLAKFHSLEVPSLNLQSFDKASGYYERQLGMFTGITNMQAMLKDRKTRQIVGPIPYADELTSFFGKRQHRPREMLSLVHGDFKIDNIVFHKTEPRVIGVLESVHLVANVSADPFANASFLEGTLPGLPDVDQVLRWYKEFAGWDPRRDFGWAAAFDSFKNAVICQGVKARMATGQTNSTLAYHYVGLIMPFADNAKRLADEILRVERRGFEDNGSSPVKVMSML